MLYNEFIEGTGCKDSEYNYNVYKELEIIYMNTDCSKAHIYEMGKKLVDNSKSEAQLKLEAEIKSQIEEKRNEITSNRKWIEYYSAVEDSRMVKYYKNENKRARAEIAALKWVLA